MAPEYSRTTTRRSSLSASGRRVFLLLVSATIALCAVSTTLLGAWLVLPFAGLEILVLLLAFWVLGVHADDYESLEIKEGAGRFESCSAGRIVRFEFNPLWAQIVCRQTRIRCDLALRFRGCSVRIGRLLSDAERLEWAQELKQNIRLVKN